MERQAGALQPGGSWPCAEQAGPEECLQTGPGASPGGSSLSPGFTWLNLAEASLEKPPLELSMDSGLALEWQDSEEREPVAISPEAPSCLAQTRLTERRCQEHMVEKWSQGHQVLGGSWGRPGLFLHERFAWVGL